MTQSDSNKKQKYPHITEDGTILHRDYCFLMDGEKYNRNIACKLHDNAYGINGGGNSDNRKDADLKFYSHLQSNQDPMAKLAYYAVRLFGWAFFNYNDKEHPWRGQLLRKISGCFRR